MVHTPMLDGRKWTQYTETGERMDELIFGHPRLL
ncbi:Protein of unknown function (plasmid) [Magnetospira sp. QH-2]|nr:Protein of unknown function [Magnetospira sp. QH-2]